MFKTIEESRQATNDSCELAWNTFTKEENINPQDNIEAYALAKRIFRTGYLCGAQFITSTILNDIIKHQNNNEPTQ